MHISFLKEPVIRDRKYLDAVRKLDCCNCGMKSPSEPHHVRIGNNSQAKPGDDKAVPLCHECHIENLHRHSEKKDWGERNPLNLAFKLRLSYATGQDDGHMNKLVTMWRMGGIK
jgi:hypothetical protein